MTVFKRARRAVGAIRRKLRPEFPGSASYWEQRYSSGRTSGPGSYGRYAEAKASVINRWIVEHEITSVVEFGCGDGNQLSLLDVPEYVGLDVSSTAVSMCVARFADDGRKSFFTYVPETHHDATGVFRRDAALSQEVLFHLVEDEVFDGYLCHLFNSAERWVLIVAADRDWHPHAHERHRVFTDWINWHRPGWKLVERIPSPIPYDDATGEGLLSDFYLFGRVASAPEAAQP